MYPIAVGPRPGREGPRHTAGRMRLLGVGDCAVIHVPAGRRHRRCVRCTVSSPARGAFTQARRSEPPRRLVGLQKSRMRMQITKGCVSRSRSPHSPLSRESAMRRSSSWLTLLCVAARAKAGRAVQPAAERPPERLACGWVASGHLGEASPVLSPCTGLGFSRVPPRAQKRLTGLCGLWSVRVDGSARRLALATASTEWVEARCVRRRARACCPAVPRCAPRAPPCPLCVPPRALTWCACARVARRQPSSAR